MKLPLLYLSSKRPFSTVKMKAVKNRSGLSDRDKIILNLCMDFYSDRALDMVNMARKEGGNKSDAGDNPV